MARLLRRTRSVCPRCLRQLDAEVVEDEGRVLIVRTCPEHGESAGELGRSVWYQEGLSRDFFALNARPPVLDPYGYPVYNLFLTMRCNMRCPMCSVNGGGPGDEMGRDEVERFLGRVRGVQINLFGGEPTVREDLPDIVRLVRASGNVPVLFTNGKRLAEPGYLDQLIEAGVAEVRLQFDSFRDEALVRLRGERLVGLHGEVLALLEARGVPTVFEVAVARGVNDGEMGDLLRYAAAHPFVRAVGFRSFTRLGRGRDDEGLAISNDELASLLEAQSDGLVKVRDVYRFQRLFYALYHLFGRLNCFLNHYYLLVRRQGGDLVPIARLVDLAALEPSLDAYRERTARGSRLAAPLLLASLARAALSPGALRAVRPLAPQLARLVLGRSVTASGVGGRVLVVGLGSPCDMLTYDLANAAFCQGANASPGRIATTAQDNLSRERSARPSAI